MIKAYSLSSATTTRQEKTKAESPRTINISIGKGPILNHPKVIRKNSERRNTTTSAIQALRKMISKDDQLGVIRITVSIITTISATNLKVSNSPQLRAKTISTLTKQIIQTMMSQIIMVI
jgi:hypothetical protein